MLSFSGSPAPLLTAFFSRRRNVMSAQFIDSLYNDDSKGNKIVIFKYKFTELLWLLRNYFNSYNHYVGQRTRDYVSKKRRWSLEKERKLHRQ